MAYSCTNWDRVSGSGGTTADVVVVTEEEEEEEDEDSAVGVVVDDSITSVEAVAVSWSLLL